MIIDPPVEPAVIQAFLREGGMPQELSQRCRIQPVEEGGLAVTFKIEGPEGTFYIKFHEAEGARGAPFLKHLLPINDLEMRVHAEKRRHLVRKMLDSVIEQRSNFVPKPCYFDLRSFPMALQRLRREKDHVAAELRMEGERYPPRLAGMVGTIWKELAIEHIPTSSPDKKDVWNPNDYSPESVFLCTAAIGEFQEKAGRFLEATVQRKCQNGKGSVEQIQGKLRRKLQHEQRALKGYKVLIGEFFSSLGGIAGAANLQAFARKILKQIEERVSQAGGASIAELQTRFLAEVSIPPKYTQVTFQKLLFAAERERWWTYSKRREGKALDQLQQAEAIAKEIDRDPTRLLAFVEEVLKFEATYEKLEKQPQAIVPQDAHPFNFFIHREDGKTTMLDLEDLSMAVRFTDVSMSYVFKILRGVLRQGVARDKAIERLQAAIRGYNSTAPTPLKREEIELMADYAMGVFLNFLPQFGIILRMDPAELDAYNLGMSLDAFMEQFLLLKEVSQLWNSMFSQGVIIGEDYGF